MKRLEMTNLKERIKKTTSTKEALKDVIPLNWNENVLNGTKSAIVRKAVK